MNLLTLSYKTPTGIYAIDNRTFKLTAKQIYIAGKELRRLIKEADA